MDNNVTIQQHQVRITVLSKLFHEEYVAQYAPNPERWTPCTHFEVGQEFVTARDAPWEMPAGFCGWAWADMQKMVWGMARGGSDVFVTCCTDGYRPVIFKLEKIEHSPDGT
ncbi:TIGR04076 family protein [bacterium]|nr:TIGR04076 family protein [bacterium]